jgi:isopenicillin N synthase-like dioxygenase
MSAADFSAIPVIGLGALAGGGRALDALVAEIGGACETAGFFYVTDHGVPQTAIDAIFAAARRFFALPQPTRDALDVHSSPNYRGYVPMGLTGSGVPKRMLEAFQVMRELGPDDPDVRAGSVMYGANRWPGAAPGFDAAKFRRAMEAYFDAVWDLAQRLLGLFARGLGQGPDYFRPFFAKPLTQLRLLHYPPQPAEAATAQGVEAHTDPSAFTILLQDAVGGLETRNRAGQWIAAPPIPGSFVINIGDMIQRWTNGRFVSTPHRVANRAGRDRISVPFFVNPDYAATIAPVLGGAAAGAARYEPLACGPYLEAAFRAAWPRAGESRSASGM